ncbi:MAG: murein L,D-transpeptidase [Chromatiaceae bacterium]|nr:MAG: murein L,D-transpeptidase [Chromatiaceae bacterium]
MKTISIVSYPVGIGLAIALIAGGCAHQPYPPLPADDYADVRDEHFAEGADAAVASAREPAKVNSDGWPLPLSQRVAVPPPDPATLSDAQQRQLDIRLANQTFNYFEDNRLIWSGPISSGLPAHPTPKGDYRVQSKQRHKRSGSYTNSFDRPTPMPFSLQFRGPYYVHEGYVTGAPASRGCVRLRYEDARFVYERMRVGDRVVVAD